MVRWIVTGSTGEVQGWMSLAFMVTFFSGLILLALGIIGEYLWRIFDNTKRHPLFIVDTVFEGDPHARE
jgi:dolichol-phosphate mannosyltransferase